MTATAQSVAGFSALLDDSLFNETNADLTANNQTLKAKYDKAAGVYSPEQLTESIKEHFYLNFEWEVPFPHVPRVPLLYIPEAVKDAFKFPPKEAQTADLDAMGHGVLETMPMVPYLTRPQDIREMTQFVRDCNTEWEKRNDELRARGINPSYVVDPREKNPTLTQEDYDLIDVDFHIDSINDRNLPSLALLQKPLYTEMDEVPRDVRAAARLQRLKEQAGLKEQTPRRAAKHEKEIDEAAQFATNTQTTFKNSNQLEVDFEKFLIATAESKLGLVGLEDKKTASLLVRLLFRHLAYLTVPQQKAVWCAACNMACEKTQSISDAMVKDVVDSFVAARNVDIDPTVQEQQRTAGSVKNAPQDEEFASIMSQKLHRWADLYRQALAKVDVKARLSSITHGTYDVAGSNEVDFNPAKGVSRVTKLKQTDKVSDPVPLAVLPVFPSNYQQAVQTPIDGETNPYTLLGAQATNLTHICLDRQKGSATVEDIPMPHVVMETTRAGEQGCALLNPVSDAGAHEEPESGSTANYKMNVSDQFIPVIHETENLGSYVMDVQDDVVVYDRIGKRTIYERNTSTKVFRADGSFVVVWEDEQEAGQRKAGASTSDAAKKVVGEKRKASDVEEEVEQDVTEKDEKQNVESEDEAEVALPEKRKRSEEPAPDATPATE